MHLPHAQTSIILPWEMALLILKQCLSTVPGSLQQSAVAGDLGGEEGAGALGV